jgi:hypothetical protein
MIETEGELKDLMSEIHACSAHVRNSCKVNTALRNKAAAIDLRLTNVSAKGESTTRQWLGAAICMKQHKKIQPMLQQLALAKAGKIRDHQHCLKLSFMDKVDLHYPYMRIIRGCSDALQKKGRTLKGCQWMLDILRRKVEKGHGKYGDAFDKCDLDLQYIKPNNQLSTSPAFETGIAKIQGGLREE